MLLLPVSDNLMNRAHGPIKLGDHLAAGRAVLANPVGDLAEFLGPGSGGTLAADSPQAYSEEFAALLLDPVACRTHDEQAREFAEQQLAWKFPAPRLGAIYDRACAGF